MSDNREHARRSSEALAALYSWGTIAAILESGADPGRLDSESGDASITVLKIARKQQQHALRVYDNAVRRIKP